MEENETREKKFFFKDFFGKHTLRICASLILCAVAAVSIFSAKKAGDLDDANEKNPLADTPPITDDIPVISDTATDTPEQDDDGETDDPIADFIPVGEIRIPQCTDISYSLSSKKSDFYFENPASNSCFLKVSIIRLDTNESIYSSSQISPGNSVSGISFISKITKQGVYPVMIKIDAYALDRMLYLNSLAIDNITITAY